MGLQGGARLSTGINTQVAHLLCLFMTATLYVPTVAPKVGLVPRAPWRQHKVPTRVVPTTRVMMEVREDTVTTEYK